MLGGLVAGEGWFANSLAGKAFADGSPRRRCTQDGCDEPRRAKQLCRRHYYEAFGR